MKEREAFSEWRSDISFFYDLSMVLFHQPAGVLPAGFFHCMFSSMLRYSLLSRYFSLKDQL